jgi:hypothetical protein
MSIYIIQPSTAKIEIDIITSIKAKRLEWAGHVVRKDERKVKRGKGGRS